MQRHGTHVERTAYERRRPAPTLGRALAAAGVPLLLAVLAEPLMAVLALEALVLVAARRRL